MSGQLRNFSESNVTMSSMEIAVVTGKQHKNVLADCRSLICEYEKIYINQAAEISALINSTSYTDSNGDKQPAFSLSKQATLDLVTGYSLPMRHAVNKRWLELENQNQKVPQSFSQALRLAAELQDQLESAHAKIEADKPKVDFAMAIRNLDGSCLVEEFAKTIGTGRNTLFKQLREGGYLMVNNLPYQKYIDLGWFVVIENTPFTDSKGKSHPTFTTRITGKGQVALEKKLRKDLECEA